MINGEMEKIFFAYFQSELDELKSQIKNLEETIMKNEINEKEIKRKINELVNTKDHTKDIFSPVNHSDDFIKEEVDKLKKNVKLVKKQILQEKQTKKQKKEKFDEINKMVNLLMESKKNNIVTEKIEKEENIDIQKCVEKISFCRKICVSDGQRCKMELDNLLEMFHVKHEI